MEDFISILMGGSLLGLAKTDNKLSLSFLYQWKTDVWENELLRASCYKLNGKKLSIKEHVHTNSSKNWWRWLSKEQTVNE